jgi:hypothetical protein
MAEDGSSEVQQKLEAIALELKNENDPDRRRTLLKEMVYHLRCLSIPSFWRIVIGMRGVR